jgi:epoxyqueuosine reductase
MDEQTFATYADGSPLRRPGHVGMARNAAIVLGNSRDRRHLPLLDDAARAHESELVREAAAWAARELRSREE